MKKFFFTGTILLVAGVLACFTMSFKSHSKTESSDCVTYAFSAYEDGVCIATMDLYSNCTFLFINKEERPHIRTRGTYEMSGSLEKGGSNTIRFYVDGEYQGYGTIVWPSQGKVYLIFGDYTFR